MEVQVKLCDFVEAKMFTYVKPRPKVYFQYLFKYLLKMYHQETVHWEECFQNLSTPEERIFSKTLGT